MHAHYIVYCCNMYYCSIFVYHYNIYTCLVECNNLVADRCHASLYKSRTATEGIHSLPLSAMSSEDSLIVSQNGEPPSRHARPNFFRSVKRKIGSTKSKQGSLPRYQQSGKFQDSYVLEMEPPTPTSEQRRRLDEQPKKSSCKAKFVSFCFTFTVFLFVLVSAALSKVCFVNIAAQLNANSSVGNGSGGAKRRSIAFVQLVLVLCVPQAFTILKTLFLGILGKTVKRFPWPTWKALLKVCVCVARTTRSAAFTYIPYMSE